MSAASKRQVVWAIGVMMVAAQAGFRCWMLAPSWFWADDYRLILQARAVDSPGPAYLFRSFDSHLMPAGRLMAWVLAQAGPTNWALAATSVLVLQVAASLACLWMLVTLFGARWACLALLALYLTSAVTVPAFVWWAASLNQLGPQVTFPLAIALWVRYLRTPRVRTAVASVAVVAVGLLFDVRAVLVVPTILVVTLVCFSSGSPRHRVRGLLVRAWPGLVLGGVLVGAYAAFYLVHVPAPFEGQARPDPDPLGLADRMLATSAVAGAVGGPWRWLLSNPPVVLASPPTWSVHVAWVVLVMTATGAWLRRHGTAGGWLVLGVHAGLLYALLALTRGRLFGPVAGLEYRYMTELAVVLPLALGLVLLDLPDAPGGSRARSTPLLLRPPPPWSVAAAVLMICTGGVVSSVRYVGYWHHQNANRTWVKQVQDDLAQAGETVDLPSQVVPDLVMPAYTRPANRTENLIPYVAPNARFPRATDDLRVIDGGGHLRRAAITDGPASVPGTRPGCGTLVKAPGGRVRLDGSAFDYGWWIRIAYLSSQRSPITVTAGDDRVRTEVRAGLHNLYVHVESSFEEILVSDLASGTSLCVDTVEVGQPAPLED